MLIDELAVRYPVVKEVNAIRKRGMMLEDVLDYLQSHYDFDGFDNEFQITDFYATRAFIQGSDIVGWYFSDTTLGGIPTLKVGCMNKEVWEIVRNDLRKANLIR